MRSTFTGLHNMAALSIITCIARFAAAHFTL